MKKLVIPLAFGDIFMERGYGPIKQPFDGAVDRFRACIEHVLDADTNTKPNVLIVCTAGYDGKKPLEPCENRLLSLAGQLRRYVTGFAPGWSEYLLTGALCWSTRNEIRLAIKIALRNGFGRDEPVEVILASHPYHLWRIRQIYLRMYMPKAWRATLIPVRHPFPLKELVLGEPYKFLRDMLYMYRVWFRRDQMRFGPSTAIPISC